MNKLKYYRKYSDKAYQSQKGFGKVYCLFIKGEDKKYIGSTFNSLKFRLRQHKSWPTKSMLPLINKYSKGSLEIKLLWEATSLSSKETLKEIEQSFIESCPNSINIKDAVKTPQRFPSNTHKGGITYKETWYKTKKELWEKLGTSPFGTFKTRLHRGKSMEEALG